MAEKPINKAKQVREALGLSRLQCGELFTGNLGHNGRDIWTRWERTGKWSAPAEKLFNIILALEMAERFKTRNCHGALKMILKMLDLIDDLE